MTIERIAQFTAETRVLTDVSRSGTGSGTLTIASTQAKTGTYAYKTSLGVPQFGKALSSPISAIRMGYWLYLASTSITSEFGLYTAGNGSSIAVTQDHIHVRYVSGTGLVEVRRPSGPVSSDWLVMASVSAPSQFSTSGTWFHIGITHYIHATDGYLSIYINGTLLLTLSGDTRSSQSGSTFSTAVAKFWGGGAIGSSSGFNDSYLDDMYIDRMDGEADAPVPSRRFLMALPTSAGADAAFTAVPAVANYLNADENPNDGDATYNKALSANLRDTFNVGDITLPADHRIVAVLPTPFARRLDSEIAHQLSVHAYDGVTYLDSADLDLSMSYDVPVFARLPLQPDGSAWSEADFNNMQFGYRSRGTF